MRPVAAILHLAALASVVSAIPNALDQVTNGKNTNRRAAGPPVKDAQSVSSTISTSAHSSSALSSSISSSASVFHNTSASSVVTITRSTTGALSSHYGTASSNHTASHSGARYTNSSATGASISNTFLSTSTVFETETLTVTACPKSVTDCPASEKTTYTTVATTAYTTLVPFTTSTLFSTQYLTVTACPGGTSACSVIDQTTQYVTVYETFTTEVPYAATESGTIVTTTSVSASTVTDYITYTTLIPYTSTVVNSGTTSVVSTPTVSTIVTPTVSTIYITTTLTEICAQGACSPYTATASVNSGPLSAAATPNTGGLLSDIATPSANGLLSATGSESTSTIVSTVTNYNTNTFTVTMPVTTTYLTGASLATSAYHTIATTTWVETSTIVTTITVIGTSTVSAEASESASNSGGWYMMTSYTYPAGYSVPTSFNIGPTGVSGNSGASAPATTSPIVVTYSSGYSVPTSSNAPSAGSSGNSGVSSISATTPSISNNTLSGYSASASSNATASLSTGSAAPSNATTTLPCSDASTRTPSGGSRTVTTFSTNSGVPTGFLNTTSAYTTVSISGSNTILYSSFPATTVSIPGNTTTLYSSSPITTSSISGSNATLYSTYLATASSISGSNATLYSTYPATASGSSGFNATMYSTYPATSASAFYHNATATASSTGNSTIPTATPTSPPESGICTRTLIEGCTPCEGQGEGPWCGFDLNTDYYTYYPKTCGLVQCSLTLVNTTLAPDGVERIVLTFNGQFPGPLIEAQWGDTVEVTVTNMFADNGSSIHWHGIRQWNTSQYDGVASITQCPIAGNGGTMTYTWLASQYGHSWYHSHYSVQAWDGVIGPLIVSGPTTAEFDIDLGSVMLTDWAHFTAFSVFESVERTTQPTMDNVLINGQAIWGTNGSYVGERAEFAFVPGKRHRMQLVMTAIDSTFAFSIDQHTITVIGVDWTPIVPYQTDVLKITIGQRYDIIVEANQEVSDYWMRVDPLTFSVDPGVVFGCGADNMMQGNTMGIVHYDGSWYEPTTTAYPHDNTCNDEPYDSIVPWLPLSVGESSDTLSSAVTLIQNTTSSVFRWYLSGSTFQVEYKQPTLLSVLEQNDTYYGPLSIDLPTAQEWIYVIVESPVPLSHPIHLHGHDIYLLGSGNFSTYTDQPLNLVNPPRRDVVTMPTKGWIVIAFLTDNPGAWLLHCHIGWHLSMGFALQIIEQKDVAESQITPSLVTDQCEAWNRYTSMQYIDQLDSGV